ncbi:MAG: hypothetical protein RR351_04490, partial [Christensenella sp.]
GDLAIAPNEIAVGQIRVSTDVTESEKRLIAQNLNGKTAAMYLDLTCAVVFYNADTGAFRVQQLTDMQQPMRLTVDIGEYADKGENYCVLREHAGVVDELAATLNGTLLTFESSKFSTYSVAYTAFAQPTPTPTVTPAPTAAPSEPAPSEPAPTVAPSGSIPPARSAAKTKTTDAAASAEANLETAVSVPTVAAVVVPKESGKEHTSEKSDTEAAQAQKKTEENAQTTGAVRLMWQILICIALAVVIVAAVWVVKKHKKNSKKRKRVKK